MKKILALLSAMVIVLSMSSCKNSSFTKNDANGVSAQAKEFGYFHYKKCDFGITPDEMLKNLNMKKSDFTVTNEDGTGNIYKAKLDFSGEKLTTIFTFSSTLEESKEFLSYISVMIPAKTSSMDKIKTMITDYLKAFGDCYKLESSSSSITVTTKNTVTGLPKSYKDSYNAAIRNISKKAVNSSIANSNNKDTDYFANGIEGRGQSDTISQMGVTSQKIDSDGEECYMLYISSPIAEANGNINLFG